MLPIFRSFLSILVSATSVGPPWGKKKKPCPSLSFHDLLELDHFFGPDHCHCQYYFAVKNYRLITPTKKNLNPIMHKCCVGEGGTVMNRNSSLLNVCDCTSFRYSKTTAASWESWSQPQVWGHHGVKNKKCPALPWAFTISWSWRSRPMLNCCRPGSGWLNLVLDFESLCGGPCPPSMVSSPIPLSPFSFLQGPGGSGAKSYCSCGCARSSA